MDPSASTPAPGSFDPGTLPESALDAAVAHLARDGVIAYPTETVWGLGACADRPRAIARLFAWKGRAEHQPLAVLVPNLEAAALLGCELDPNARRLAARFWPGPLMLVVRCHGRFAPGVARGDGALGIRCSPHPVARALSSRLAREGLGPLTSTSLNRSGDPPAGNLAQAELRLARGASDRAESIDHPLLVAPSGYDAGASAPSTVVDCTRAVPEILREGALLRAEVESVWSQ
jgi:L-threonylcarbamoyladenylate synthase